MKANKFFLGLAFVGAILTACNNDQGSVTGPDGDAYVSVKISMASAGTRATTDGGFDFGTPTEQAIDVDKSIFLFYDAAGKWVTSGKLSTTTVSEENKATGNNPDHATDINDLSAGAYIVLSGPDEDLKKSTQVLTIVNYSKINSLLQLDLDEALAFVTDTENDPANAGFLMSTSVYSNGTNIVTTTAIDPEKHIQQTQELALANPVKIYIERASAKAELAVTATGELGTDKGIVVDGAITAVNVNVTGWTLNNVHESTYLVKQLDEDWIVNPPFQGWNWADNFRSYWAKGTNWTAIDNTGNTVYTYAQATNAVGTTPVYCYENTVAEAKIDTIKGTASPNVNTVLIAANFNLAGKTGTQDFFRYNGVYYTEANYKNLILKQIQDEGHKKANGNDFTVDDLTIESNGTLAGIKFTIAGEETVQNFVNELSYVKNVEGYKDGMCYYQIPVEHIAGYGMVRNHWYKIDIKSIKRIGEAVYNPNVIIPDIPVETQDFYLAAEIHVLSWHVVNQTVEL